MDGWDAWFLREPAALARDQAANTSSVAELWIGFLDFYSGTWDDRSAGSPGVP